MVPDIIEIQLANCLIDHIEYDLTTQIPALQHGVCKCVGACAIQIKLGTLRPSLMYAFRRAYGLAYNMASVSVCIGVP